MTHYRHFQLHLAVLELLSTGQMYSNKVKRFRRKDLKNKIKVLRLREKIFLYLSQITPSSHWLTGSESNHHNL